MDDEGDGHNQGHVDYVFEQTDHVDYDRDSTTPLAVERLLMEGARMVDEWPIIEKVVRSLDLVYQRVPVAQPVIPADDEELIDSVEAAPERSAKDRRLDPIRISRAEWAVYELIDARRSVAEINELTFLSEFEGCKAFYDLVSRGLVEEVGAPHRQGADLAAAPSAARRPVDMTLFVGLGLALLGLVGLHFQARNPVNLLSVPRRPSAVLDDFRKTESFTQPVGDSIHFHNLFYVGAPVFVNGDNIIDENGDCSGVVAGKGDCEM